MNINESSQRFEVPAEVLQRHPSPLDETLLPLRSDCTDPRGQGAFNQLRRRAAGLFKHIDAMMVAFGVFLVSQPAFGAAGLDSLTAKIQELNSELVSVGGVLAITGFIWACLAIMIGLAGAAKAITVLIVGLAIAAAPQIVGFLTS